MSRWIVPAAPRRRWSWLARFFGRIACAIENWHPVAEWDAWACPRCGETIEASDERV